ncbi:peptidoglycan-binding domain-containing protein [Kribbella shirazensis]|jgi:murein L,D-transpeptidase YcbB/YkuD|uniref:Murein L,D-transpeptidase YcbB/YkuD n=1 Tax=Kribbella shirazensis TaxID=1105143 RepID=A0A7X5V9A1_9ACTN|nr:peptidoglycan-binding domain-containing protein [Kribbella shirazensis]NIK56581.1 murein L,D-transpeptidase YcbB/YkuD [Kribbella shirazensis]
MAFSLPSLPKLSGRTIALLAAVGAVAVGAVAANASKQESPPAAGAPAPAPQGQTDRTGQTDQPAAHEATAAELRAAAALPQCRSARLVPVNRTWGIPMPSILGSTSTTCNLMYGDDPFRGSNRTGDPETAIQVLQRNLNFCYGTKLAVDGIYGSRTRAAVRAVQTKHRLVVDGIYGPKTRSAMNWRLYSMATRSWSKGCSSPL